MEQFHLPWTMDELETRLLRVITDGLETKKIDFKQQIDLSDKKAKVDLATDVCAIANSDDPEAHRDYGFVILGAVPKQLVGGVTALEPAKRDTSSASLIQFLKEYLAPLPTVHLVGFVDATLGPWGAIVVAPSYEQPHVFVREHGEIRRGDVFVRVGDTNAVASAPDYGRFMRKAATAVVSSYERRLQDQELRIAKLEHRRIRGGRPVPASESPVVMEASPPQTTADLVRTQLGGQPATLDAALLGDAVHLAARRDEVVPWALHARHTSPAALREYLDQLEAITEPVARATANLVRYDTKLAYARTLRRLADVVAEVRGPLVGTPFTDEAVWLRAYPYVLLLHAALVPAIAEERVGLVVELLRARPALGPRATGNRDPIRHVRACSYYLTELFNRAREEGERRYFYPQGDRIAGCVRRWTGDLAIGQSASGLFFVAEFLLVLLALDRGQRTQGSFLYMHEAEEPIAKFLQARPTWADPLFSKGLRAALELFDAQGETLLPTEAWGRAEFLGKTVALYDGDPEQ